MADNEFGYTSWGMGWVRLAEPLTLTRPDPLLPRARSIARNNAVQLEIEGRHIRASIHRAGQASVTYLEVAPLPAASITALGNQIGTATVELGDAVHDAVVSAGITLAPRLGVTDCSCSARKDSCLHMLATCYAVARRVDENPWLALDLQGFRDTATQVDDTAAPPARWTPLDSLNPAAYFTPVRWCPGPGAVRVDSDLHPEIRRTVHDLGGRAP